VCPLWRMYSSWTFSGSKNAPTVATILGCSSAVGLFRLTVEGSAEGVDQPIGHGSELRREEAPAAIVLAQ